MLNFEFLDFFLSSVTTLLLLVTALLLLVSTLLLLVSTLLLLLATIQQFLNTASKMVRNLVQEIMKKRKEGGRHSLPSDAPFHSLDFSIIIFVSLWLLLSSFFVFRHLHVDIHLVVKILVFSGGGLLLDQLIHKRAHLDNVSNRPGFMWNCL